jgi:hypothetical protein
MASYAKLSTQRIVHVLDAMPDYAKYTELQGATENETNFRLALGYVLKAWGDQLLDLAEEQPRALSRTQTRMVDTLLEGIGEVFHTLNSMQGMDEGTVPPELLDSDARLLENLERAQRMILELRQREFSGVWIEKHAKPLFRALRRIEKILASRNDLLGIGAIASDSGPVDAQQTGGLF